ncbi:hypothetical protein E1B28_001169 [Marasmius oreades]|uniref:Uncharacterized protein n=1 Tax=Marasmius oreades TaxID=181124 RepID=A0A9P8AEW6_9AGAR|nr:uncharacterized protein E1B28_001169 [Marasmius oreades]KAG7099311.1 hypothetical protein E1B28_001169 [Marasmius oreades]
MIWVTDLKQGTELVATSLASCQEHSTVLQDFHRVFTPIISDCPSSRNAGGSMSHRTQTGPQPEKRHISATSTDTNASGVAESAISYSAFPEPPSSIPSTPTRSTISASATPRPNPVPPLKRLRNPRENSSFKPPIEPLDTPYSRSVSPHDWHEGASSIDVDATEDRLLSTSFITSLLQESSDASTRRSINSDAISAFSEMTYPPPSRQFISASHSANSPASAATNFSTRTPNRKYPSQRPVGSRPAPSPYSPIPESFGLITDDTGTMVSTVEPAPAIIPPVGASRSQALHSPIPVIGATPATLRTVPGTSHRLSPDVGQSEPSDGEDKALVDHGTSSYPQHHTRKFPFSQHSQSRQSFHSSRSIATSVISRLSAGVARVLPWRKTKPLPPVPTIPIAAQITDRREEAQLQLSDLAARAETLNELLEKGYHPHQSVGSSFTIKKLESQTSALTTLRSGGISQHPLQPRNTLPLAPTDGSHQRSVLPANRKRYCVILVLFIIIAGAAIGAGVGVTVSRKGPITPKCAGQFTGMACDLNATCVCIPSTAGSCNALASAVIDAIPLMNDAFSTNYTLSSTYNSLWLAHAATSSSDCGSQALLIDAAPGLKFVDSPNRTQWARSALLWTVLQTQDVQVVQNMQKALQNAPWSSVGSSDGVVEDKKNAFSTSASGFTFNFASQTVTQPSVTFVNNGQPSNAQIGRVGGASLDALNRMYSYAFASSTQRQTALSTYWSSVLQQRPEDLPSFKSAITSAPILLPFDATFKPLTSLMRNDSNSPFPPPLGCYSGLNQSVIDRINKVEQGVFGLSAVSPASSFDISCFPGRPIYGVLDVLRLRLPFIDSHAGTGKQAVVLRQDVYPRAILHTGELLSALGPFSETLEATPFIANPRDHGTVNNVNHVILNFLLSISDVNLAMSLIQFILLARGTPPPDNGFIAKSLSSIPSIEVAIFGSVSGADVTSAVSSFSTPSGSMFFGSSAAQAMRQWSIDGLSGAGVSWTENATSQEIARDNKLDDSIWNDVWRAASTALERDAPNVGIKNVTDSLRNNGKFSP